MLKQLNRWYPAIPKVVFVNGRKDNPEEQQQYLENIKKFLAPFSNIQVKYFEDFIAPTELWNKGLIAAPTEKVALLNDSVTVTGPFVEQKMLAQPFCKINNSFSNYIIAKSVIGKIGWFDQNFIAGASETDGDMEARIVLAGIPIYVRRSLFITWRRFENPVVWDKALGGVIAGKASQYNNEYFYKKWQFSRAPFAGAKWVPISSGYIAGPNPGFETPDPYPDVRKEWQKKYPL